MFLVIGKKKMKGKTINLTEFLSDDKGGSPAPTFSSNKIDWAAEMDSNDFDGLYQFLIDILV